MGQVISLAPCITLWPEQCDFEIDLTQGNRGSLPHSATDRYPGVLWGSGVFSSED